MHKNKMSKKQIEKRKKMIGGSIFFITLFITISLATSAVYAFGLNETCNIKYSHKHRYYRHVVEMKEEKEYLVRIIEGKDVEYQNFSEEEILDGMNIVFEVINKTPINVIEEIWSEEEILDGWIKTNDVNVNYNKKLENTKEMLEKHTSSNLNLLKTY